MKKILMMCAVALAAFCAMADTWTDPSTGITWTYTVSGGEACVGGGDLNSTAVPRSTNGAITIPSTLGGRPVTSIGGYAFDNCSGLTSVTIPSSVTSIGACAFEFCDGLTAFVVDESNGCYKSVNGLLLAKDGETLISGINGNVEIPEGVTSIGDEAFYCCRSGLTSVTIPSSVTSIGEWAFYGCSGLTAFVVNESNGCYKSVNGLLLTKDGETLISGINGNVVIPSSVTSIGVNAFRYYSRLTSVTIPDSVMSIGAGAFYGCSRLTSVTIPDSVTSIGRGAFGGCNGLGVGVIIVNGRVLGVNGACPNQVILPEGTRIISDYAFDGCSGLTSVTIPSGVTSIGYAAFSYCSGLTSVTIPDSVTSIGEYVFCGCSGLTSVTIPDTVTSIGAGAFYGCSGLTSVTIPPGMTSIGGEAFRDCSGLTSVIISEGVMSIGQGAFSDCTGLTSVTLPDSVTSIGAWAFSDCSGLTSVTIPSSVTSIDYAAFAGCDNLDAIDFEGAPPAEVANAAIKTDAAIRYNWAYKDQWLGIIGWCGWTNVKHYYLAPLPDGGPYTETVDGIEWTFMVSGGKASVGGGDWGSPAVTTETMGAISIPSTLGGCPVTSIGDYAFSECSSLTSVTIPEGMTSIGDYAFSECSELMSVTIGEGVTSIGVGAFYECSSLTNVVIPNSVTSIGDYAFFGCSGLTSITISDSVTSIGDQAFCCCRGLTNVTIGDGVMSIGGAAFMGCWGLTSVTIPNGVTSIGDQAFYDCRGLTSVTIGDGVMSIGGAAFMGCWGITNVTIPESVTSIGNWAFYNCSGLTDLTIPGGVTSIGDRAFCDCRGLTSVTIGKGVMSIGDGVFSECERLSAINVDSNNVTYSSQDGILFSKDKTTLLLWPCGKQGVCVVSSVVTSIEQGAFSESGGLSAIVVDPDNATFSSQDGILYNKDMDALLLWPCGKQGVCVVSSAVTSIGQGAFSGCGRPLDFEGAPPEGVEGSGINQDVTICYNVAYEAQWLPVVQQCEWANAKPYTPGAPRPAGGSYVEVVDGIEWTFMVDVNLNASLGAGSWDGPAIPQSTEGAIVIPAKLGGRVVTSIGGEAFSECSELTSVTIGEGVTSIGVEAFYECSSLTNVVIPNSVTNIDACAFIFCSGLTSVTMPDSVTSIGGEAFWGCESMEAIDFEGAPPLGVEYAEINPDAAVRYNAAFKAEWMPVVKACGWTNAKAFMIYLSLAEALGAEGQTITTDGNAPWTVVETEEDWAVRSGAIGKSSETWVECVVTNGCRVAFQWKVSCEPEDEGEMYDFLSFSIDGEQKAAICGEVSWTNDVYAVSGAGEHVLRWTYQKDNRTSEGEDCGWIREVRVDPEVSVTFDGNGATAGAVPTIPTAYLGDTMTVPGNGMLKKSCHAFGGWQCGKATYQEGAEILLETNAVAFVAVWHAKTLGAPTLVTPETDHVETERMMITLQAPENAEGIRYTLDGSEPTAASAVYAGPFEVADMAVTVKAVAFAYDWFDSACATWVLTRAPWSAAECLNAETRDFSFGGNADWVRDLNVTHDGVAAMRSGAVGNKKASEITMSVTGTGTVSFWCKVSSEYEPEDGEVYDGLAVSVDGKDVYDDLIGGEIGWTNVMVSVSGEGEHVIGWRYEKDRTGSGGEDCAWLDEVRWTAAGSGPTVEGDPGATVAGDAESGYTVQPSAGKTAVEVTIPAGVDAKKVTVEVGTDVETVKPNGAKVKVVKGADDITDYLDIPAADAGGAVDLTKATVKEAVVKEALDPEAGAEITLSVESPSITTSETKPGLTYTFSEGTTLEGLTPKSSKLGDGSKWSPTITVKGGTSGFYSIGVKK